ncbi:CsbD family protein [Thiorhodococcus minor]|uniref:CsbD family protein n=1 Tax=Thiorhodococcus minor TaxID=57489 RepID=A0A6M0K2W4_9GAMM|nr:CsbD family protein [Thiorhodococcus minor]
MQRVRVKGRWRQVKGSACAKWGELTDDEIEELDGNRQGMVGKMQAHDGIAKQEAERQVDESAKSDHKSDFQEACAREEVEAPASSLGRAASGRISRSMRGSGAPPRLRRSELIRRAAAVLPRNACPMARDRIAFGKKTLGNRLSPVAKDSASSRTRAVATASRSVPL